MLRAIFLQLLLTDFGYAVTLNYTRISQCTQNFLNSNHTEAFKACLSTAEITSKKPKACYQSEAALYALKTVFYVSMGLIVLSLMVNYGTILIKFLSKKYDCCPESTPVSEDSSSPSPPSLNLLQSMAEKTVATLGTVVTGVITYVSTGWIYALWQSWTEKDANCQFDLDQL